MFHKNSCFLLCHRSPSVLCVADMPLPLGTVLVPLVRCSHRSKPNSLSNPVLPPSICFSLCRAAALDLHLVRWSAPTFANL